MKKIIPVLIFALLLCALAACGSAADSKETVTEISTADSPVGSAAEPEEAPETDAAEEAEETEEAPEAEETEEAPEAAAAEEAAEDSQAPAGAFEPADYTAALTFVNDSDTDIAELYIALAGDDSPARNILTDTLAAGETMQLNGSVSYDLDTALEIRLVDTDGAETVFSALDLSALSDPENITVTLTAENGALGYALS